METKNNKNKTGSNETTNIKYYVICLFNNKDKGVSTKNKKGKNVILHGLYAIKHLIATEKLPKPYHMSDWWYDVRTEDKTKAEEISKLLREYGQTIITTYKDGVRVIPQAKKTTNNTKEVRKAAQDKKKKINKKSFANRLLRVSRRKAEGKHKNAKKVQHGLATKMQVTNIEKRAKKKALEITKKINEYNEKLVELNKFISEKQAEHVKLKAAKEKEQLKFAA